MSMEKRENPDYLSELLSPFSDIEAFTQGMTFDSFQRDKRTIYAVMRCIEVISEASQKISRDIKEKYPAVPWLHMSGMKNKMIYECFNIDINILWQTIQEDIPSLRKFILETAIKPS